MTLTEFNQNPSRATRLAEREPVTILRRGRAALRLEQISVKSTDPVQALIDAGLATPRRRQGVPPKLQTITTDIDLVGMLEADRNRLG